MSAVTLVFVDPDDRLDAAPDLEVRDAASYLAARRAVDDALASDDSPAVRVAVYGSRMQRWVRDLAQTDGADVSREGLRHRLEARWRRALPPGLSAGEIRALGLDTVDVSPDADLGAVVIAREFGDAWAAEAPGSAHLAALVLEDHPAPATPWLRDTLARRLDGWEQGALAEAYRALRDRPAAFREAVLVRVAAHDLGSPDPTALLALHPAEEVHPAAVRRAAEAVLRSPSRTAAVGAGRALLAPTLLAYWRGRLSQAGGAVAEAAAALPGASVQELVALAEAAGALDSAFADRRLGRADLDGLRATFGGFDGSAAALRRLEALVVPDPPPDPDAAWADATRLDPWQPWLDAYLPYRAALDRLGAPPEDLGALGRQATVFSDWFTARYPVLQRDSDDLVTSVHRTVREHLDRGERVLWVVWDNLPAHHAAPLVAAFEAAGLSLSADVDWRLALLPSVTAVSFPALLAGRRTAPREGTNDAGRTALLEGTFPSRSVRFRNTLREVERLGTDPADLSVVHFTSYDALLHKAEHELDDDRDVLLNRERRAIARRLAAAFQAFPHDRPARLVVTSDHGSTRLPPDATDRVSLPVGAEEVEAYSSRAVRVPAGTPSSDDVCTRLDADATGLPGPVLLARGFRSWSTTRRGGGYVHGGALPEEVLVPLVVLGREAVAMDPLVLDVEVPAPLAVGGEGALRVTVRNPNGHPARAVRLAVEVGGAGRSLVAVGAVPGGAASTVDFPFTPLTADVEGGEVAAVLVATATALGRPLETRAPMMVPVQSALRSQTNDDLFDF